MEKSILLNGQAVTVGLQVDKNHYIVRRDKTNIILTGKQIEGASKVNLELPRGNEILLNWYLINKIKKKLSRKSVIKVNDYFVLNLKWGLEDYENISLALGYNEQEELVLLKWLRNWLLTFPDNCGWLESVTFLSNTKFDPKFVSIDATIAYYPKKWEIEIQCCDGFSIEIREKLVEVFPFF